MSMEENKAKILRFYDEVINKGNLSIIDDLVSANIVDHHIPLNYLKVLRKQGKILVK